MLGFTVGTRKPDACGLTDVVDAHEDQIEAAGADPAGFQIDTEFLAKQLDGAFQIFRISDGLGETQFGAWHFRRDQRRQRLLCRPERLIETQQHIAAKTQA
jgi:hypothetical protein